MNDVSGWQKSILKSKIKSQVFYFPILLGAFSSGLVYWIRKEIL
ncbi:hypothetical protein LEP1GSC016_2454 [Leptospira borgpetersenii serovar Hardjo-bovis str. Sponselee]|uniref:Uncharacterized protein n=1 Tax=Leptospira borgpetersenii serovar Hardjo-bovis str. Sponselee TaxID=1303729 RepID=M6BB99_LEPBO|nr:hypothetical protein LEP1GSC016_2454 [Leptospira borgpetersenii serovar Hardjo-bovis str. Sponselee]